MNFSLNKKMLAGLVFLVLFLVLIIPNITSAVGLVTCGNTVTADGKFVTPCNFDEFVNLINDIIDWIIGIAGVIFTISTIYGGFLYMTSGENPGNKEKAKKILTGTLFGFVVILCAWLIVFTLLNYLVPRNPDSNLIFRFLGGR